MSVKYLMENVYTTYIFNFIKSETPSSEREPAIKHIRKSWRKKQDWVL